MPAVKLGVVAEDRFFAGELLLRIERRVGIVVIDVSAGRINVREVGAERPALAVDIAVRGDDQEQKAGRRRQQQRDGDEPHALARQPVAAAQTVAYPVHGGSRSEGVPH